MPDQDDDRTEGDAGRDPNEPFQVAARQMIDAARAILDWAEEMVTDPRAADVVSSTLGALGRAARQGAAEAVRTSSPPRPGADDEGEPPGGGVQRIPVT